MFQSVRVKFIPRATRSIQIVIFDKECPIVDCPYSACMPSTIYLRAKYISSAFSMY